MELKCNLKKINCYKVRDILLKMPRIRDAKGLVIYFLASKYCLKCKDGTPMYEEDIKKEILSNYDGFREIFKNYGIIKHPIHGDSQTLDNAFTSLAQLGFIQRLGINGEFLWDLSISPLEYFNEELKEDINDEILSELERLSWSINPTL